MAGVGAYKHRAAQSGRHSISRCSNGNQPVACGGCLSSLPHSDSFEGTALPFLANTGGRT